VQDGKITVGSDDILTNLPYVPGIGLWFDHHSSEISRNEDTAMYRGRFEIAPSAARVVYNHYGAAALGRYDSLLESVDKSDAAQLLMEDVTNPSGWMLLSYVIDPRTGLALDRDVNATRDDEQGTDERDEAEVFVRHLIHPGRIFQGDDVVEDGDRAETKGDFWIIVLPPMEVDKGHDRDAQQHHREGQNHPRVRVNDGNRRGEDRKHAVF
jgi:hypothetical protein